MNELMNGQTSLSPMELIDKIIGDKVRTNKASKRAKDAYERCRAEEKAVDEQFAAATVEPALRAYANKQLKIALAK